MVSLSPSLPSGQRNKPDLGLDAGVPLGYFAHCDQAPPQTAGEGLVTVGNELQARVLRDLVIAIVLANVRQPVHQAPAQLLAAAAHRSKKSKVRAVVIGDAPTRYCAAK